MKQDKIIKCTACKKYFLKKDTVIVMYIPYCKECARKKAERIILSQKESAKEKKAKEKKEFEKKVRKIINEVLKEKAKK